MAITSQNALPARTIICKPPALLLLASQRIPAPAVTDPLPNEAMTLGDLVDVVMAEDAMTWLRALPETFFSAVEPTPAPVRKTGARFRAISGNSPGTVRAPFGGSRPIRAPLVLGSPLPTPRRKGAGQPRTIGQSKSEDHARLAVARDNAALAACLDEFFGAEDTFQFRRSG